MRLILRRVFYGDYRCREKSRFSVDLVCDMVWKSFYGYPAARFGLVDEADAYGIDILQSSLDLVGPFDQDHGMPMTDIVEPEPFELIDRIQAIRIYMIQLQPRFGR